MREIVSSSAAPKAIGPYSQAIKAGSFVFVSGQIALEPATGTLLQGTIQAQTRLVLQNISHILKAAGSSMEQVVKASVFLTDLKDFSAMNDVYAEFFSSGLPARETVQVSALPKGANVEISVIAQI